MPRRRKYSTDELATLMRKHDGNYGTAASELGIAEPNLREKVRRDPKLKALWQVAGSKVTHLLK